jgi:hypothetical protein
LFLRSLLVVEAARMAGSVGYLSGDAVDDEELKPPKKLRQQ